MIAVSYSNPTGQASLDNGMAITRSSVFGQHVLLHLFFFGITRCSTFLVMHTTK